MTFLKKMAIPPMPLFSRRICLAAMMLSAAAVAHGQIITNGSFENDYTGWVATGHQGIVQNDPNHPATDGSKVVVLNINDQNSNATLSQTFSTTPGQRYDLSFDYGCVGPISDQRLEVTLVGNGTLVDNLILIAAPVQQPFYVPQHVFFTANSTSTQLTFTDVSFTYVIIDSMLDNIQVNPVNANAPVITAQPQRTAVAQGNDAVFNVTAAGATSYQWQFNEVNISSATQSSYTVSAADTSKAGNYSVIVTNANGSVTSSAATLTVLPSGILLNGSFEYGSAAWVYSGMNVSTSTNPGYGIADGQVITHFNWGQQVPNGNVYQIFNTIPGQTYVVDFDLGAFSLVNQNQQSCRVSVTDPNTSSIMVTQDINVFAPGNGGRYTPQEMTFVASGSTAKLTFQDISPTTTNVDLLLDNVRVRLQSAPLITGQPQSQSALVGNPATFTVTAAGQAPLHYQWRHNDGTNWNNVGPDSSTFTIPSVQTSDAGMYDVIVTNTSGNATSNSVTLTVTVPGQFTNGSFESGYTGWTATGNQAVVSGSPFTTTDGVNAVAFNVGQQPPNGTLSQSFTTTAGETYLLTFDVGAFSQVNQNPMSMQVTLQGQGQANPVVNRTVSVNAPGNGTRYVHQSISFVADSATTTLTFQDISQTTNNVDLMLDNVQISQPTAAGSFTNGSFESNYTGWTPSGNQAIVSGSPFSATDGSNAVAFNAGQQVPNGELSQSFATTAGTGYLVTFDMGAFSQVNHDVMSMQVSVQGQNGQLVTQSFSVAAPGNGTTYVSQMMSFVADGSNATLAFQDTSATTLNVDLMLDNVKVTAHNGPFISSQPQNTSAQAGGSATFTVSAIGQGTISYQWRFNNGANWTDINGANSSSLTINPVQNTDAGSYDVVVSDQSGQPAIISSPATLTVLPAGVPVNGSFEFDYTGWTATGNQAVVSGTPFAASDGSKAVGFNVGDQPPNGTLSQTISTTAGQSYKLTFDVGAFSLVSQTQQQLQVTVTGNNNSTLLAPTVITVTAPGNGTTYVPQTYTFTADGSSATLMFQDVSQTTKNTDLMLDNVKVTTTAGPVITSQPHNAAGQVGGTASFSVGATGTPTITYQWRFNSGGGWNDIPGATASTYTINSVQNSNAGSYEVVVSDQSGQPPVTSSAATLTILPPGVPVNGSFEFDYTGWTATGNQAVVSGAPFTATDGVKAVAFNVGDQPPNGVLMQTISTAVGQSYALTFDVGAFSTVTQNEQRLQVTVQGANGALVGPQVISVFAPGNGTTYVSETVNFVADGSNATLIFQDVSQTTASTDLMLDNVKVTATNLGGFTNGSFESGLTGWTSSGNLNVDTSPPYAPTDGAHLLVFNGGQTAPNGVLSQTFATSPGQSYTLAFDVGAFSAVNQNQQRLQVSVVGPGNTSLLAPPVITVSAPGNGTAWVAQSFNFTANGTSATVTFQDVSQTTTNVDLVLDNVRVQ